MLKEKFTVLIVDDSQIIIERLVPEIEELDQVREVVVGLSFDEGKKLIDIAKFDIAIFDINLHDKSGIDLLRYLKVIKPLVMVIMMTGDFSSEKQQACMELGANYFINKFTDLENIQDIITQLQA